MTIEMNKKDCQQHEQILEDRCQHKTNDKNHIYDKNNYNVYHF